MTSRLAAAVALRRSLPTAATANRPASIVASGRGASATSACTSSPPIPCRTQGSSRLRYISFSAKAQQQQQEQQQEEQSQQKKQMPPPPRDTRLAGRRRFYKIVGIEASHPPWAQQQQRGVEEKQQQGAVDSPISAGVDGTQSATGVTNKLVSAESMRSMLDPAPSDGGNSSTATSTDWFSVTLDNRTLRTPLGLDLTVPSSALALAIAAEWDSQDPTIVPASMPLTTMVCTAIDQIASHPQVYRDNIMRYLKNDTVCYLTDPAEDRVLYRKQMKAWEELHKWAQDHLGKGEHAPARAIGNDEGLIMSRARTNKPGAGLPHPSVLVGEAEAWVNTLDAWRLIAMQAATVEAKSFLVGMAVVMGSDYRDENVRAAPPYSEVAKDAVMASRVEEEFNIEQWGLVEGGHDYDRLNCSINIHAATFLVSSISSPSSS